MEPFSSNTIGLSVSRPGRLGKISLLKVPTCSRQLPQGATAAPCQAGHLGRQQACHVLIKKHMVAGCL